MEKHFPLEFAKTLSEQANEAWASGAFVDQVTPTTNRLLQFWFAPEQEAERLINFHAGQRQAILNVIYLSEVLKAANVREAYEKVDPSLLTEAAGTLEELAREKYGHPKVAVKMA